MLNRAWAIPFLFDSLSGNKVLIIEATRTICGRVSSLSRRLVIACLGCNTRSRQNQYWRRRHTAIDYSSPFLSHFLSFCLFIRFQLAFGWGRGQPPSRAGKKKKKKKKKKTKKKKKKEVKKEVKEMEDAYQDSRGMLEDSYRLSSGFQEWKELLFSFGLPWEFLGCSGRFFCSFFFFNSSELFRDVKRASADFFFFLIDLNSLRKKGRRKEKRKETEKPKRERERENKNQSVMRPRSRLFLAVA